MENTKRTYRSFTLWICGFLSGFLATLTFHQITVWILWTATLIPFGPYKMTATAPWGIPAVFSLALWGGVWGIILGLILDRSKRRFAYWVKAFGFGAIFPSLVALLIVLPLKGHPLAGNWHWPLIAAVFFINGMWGIGTGFFLKMFLPLPRSRRQPASECSPGMLCEH